MLTLLLFIRIKQTINSELTLNISLSFNVNGSKCSIFFYFSKHIYIPNNSLMMYGHGFYLKIHRDFS
jgi:hypothetical protein